MRALADQLGREALLDLARGFSTVYRGFPENRLLAVADQVHGKPLFQRADMIAARVRDCLPNEFETVIEIVIATLGPPRQLPGYGPIENFRLLPLTRLIGNHGLQHFDSSMAGLYELTRRFTAEFDIRPFLRNWPMRTLSRIRSWAHDEDLHVRRLASEGLRPRLPWAPHLMVFKHDPTHVLEVLELLKDDEELYVRRSVANNMADILKDNPDIGFDRLERWSEHASPKRRWMIRRALRYQIRQGVGRAQDLNARVAA